MLLMMRLRAHCRRLSVAASEVSLSVDGDGIARLTLNRPSARNALGRTLIGQLRNCLAQLRHDRAARVVILQSSVDKVFCSGADLKERAKMNPTEVAQFVHSLRSSFSELQKLPQPTIAVIEGAAVGGGLEMALSCDFRIASSSAILALVETRLAIIPGAGGTQRLSRLIGASKAKELIFTGRRLNGNAAFEIGLVNHVVDGPAVDRALELAQEIIPSGPIAIRMAKQAIDSGLDVDIGTGMSIEELCYAQVINTSDRLEGIKSFLEKRTPVYKGE